MKRVRTIAATSALMAAGLMANGAGAYVLEQAQWPASQLPVPYHINTSSVPAEISGTGAASIDSGFASWTAATMGGAQCTWSATNAGTTALHANQSDRVNVIEWLNNWPSELGDQTVTIGVTTPAFFTSGTRGTTVDADIRFNNAGFAWNTTGTGRVGGRTNVDTQSIATHEEGHFLGLGHSTTHGAVMFASYAGGVLRALTADDMAGVCVLYPPGGAMATDGGTNPGGDDVGRACAADPNACNSGDQCVCTDQAQSNCFCTHSCAGTTGCPSGATCTSTMIGSLCIPGSATMGTGDTGATCMGGADCVSGICVTTTTGATSGICTQTCSDDCGCPANFQCFPTRTAGTSVCAPGTSTCNPGTDGGTTVRDSGPTTGSDAGPAGDDAAADDAAPAADAGTSGGSSGCGCTVPGGTSGHGGAYALIGLGAALVARRRKRG